MGRRSFPFVVASAAGVVSLTAASAPSPLYPVYQRLWGLSTVALTVVFAVYVIALVIALLTVGSLSDIAGRRPVASASLLVSAVGMLFFANAGGVEDLIIARVVQGFAVGAATATTTAMITESAPGPRVGALVSSAASPLGITIGAVLSGALVEYAPSPRHLVFWALGGVYLVLAAVVWAVPETRPASPPTRPGSPPTRSAIGRALVPSVGVPIASRSLFRSLIPSMAATWALAGLALSLGASIVATVFRVESHFTASIVLGVFFASAIVGSALLDVVPEAHRRWAGASALAAGVLLTVWATVTAALPVYVIGSAVAGAGFGSTFRDVVERLGAAAPDTDRGRVFAAMYVASYTAFSLPALVAGLAAEVVGLRMTAVAYGVFELLLVGIAVAIAARGPRRSRDARDTPATDARSRTATDEETA